MRRNLMSSCKSCKYYDYEGDNRKGYCEYYKSYYYPSDSCDHWKAESFQTIAAYILEQKTGSANLHLITVNKTQDIEQLDNH